MLNNPHDDATQAAHEIKALASLLFFAAESCKDVDFGALREDCMTVFYIIEKKATEAEGHLSRAWAKCQEGRQ